MSDAIRCDGCGVFAPRPNPWGGYLRAGGEKVWGPHDVPDGWVRLSASAHPMDMAVTPECQGEFCGWKCAGRWFRDFATERASEPGSCGDPECHVLHDDPSNPIHPPFYVDSRSR